MFLYVVVEGGFCQIGARVSNELCEQINITRRLVEDTLVDLKEQKQLVVMHLSWYHLFCSRFSVYFPCMT